MSPESIEQRFGPVVARCRSSRDPGRKWEVRRHPRKLTYSCNCPGWANRQTCKHSRAASATEGRSGLVDLTVDGRAIVQSLKAAQQNTQQQLAAAIQQQAEKVLREAKRRQPVRVEPIPAASILAKLEAAAARRGAAPDAISDAARRASISIWRDIERGRATLLQVEEAIEEVARRFAGSAQAAPAITATITVERGVREILLED